MLKAVSKDMFPQPELSTAGQHTCCMQWLSYSHITEAISTPGLLLCALQASYSSIDFLSPPVAAARVLGGIPQILLGGRFFDKHGARVAKTRSQHGEDDGNKTADTVVRCTESGARLVYDFPVEKYCEVEPYSDDDDDCYSD